MRLRYLWMMAPTLLLTGCDSPARTAGCDVVPTRVDAVRGDTVHTVTGLRYIELAVGSGTSARACGFNEVGYVGRLENGTVFDAGTITVVPGLRGTGEVIRGFEQAVMGMRVGGERRAIVPPELGYGSRPTGSIPANSTLIFDLRLLSVSD